MTKQQKKQKLHTNKQSWLFNPFTLGAIVTALLFLVLYAVSGELTIGQKGAFERYLKEKYGQEFVVGDVGVTGNGLAVKGAWKAEAYPKSDPSVKFEIRRDQATNEVDYETFLQTLWTKQGMKNVQDFLKKEFPDKEYFSLRITPGNTPSSPFYDQVKGKTLTLSSALENYRDSIFYELIVNDVTPTTSGEPSVKTLENAMKIVDFVKSQGAGILSVSYSYRDPSFAERTYSNQQKYQYRIKLEREAFQKASNPNDLKQYFEAIK